MVNACKPWVCLDRGSTLKMGRKLSITVNLCEGAVRTRRVWTSASAMALVGETQNSVIKWRRRWGWGWILLEWMEIKLDPTVKQFPWAALPWSIACVFCWIRDLPPANGRAIHCGHSVEIGSLEPRCLRFVAGGFLSKGSASLQVRRSSLDLMI